MASVSDHRALPDATLNLYLYPIGAWGAAAVVLFFTGYAAFSLPLLYPLSLWQIGLSAVWGGRMLRRLQTGELTNGEAHAGVRSVGQILAASSCLPAIVFLTDDPLAPAAWGTTVGALVLAGLVYGGLLALTRIGSRVTHGAAIALACFALPVNATGAVTVATMIGLFDKVVDAAPVPDALKPDLPDLEPAPRKDRRGERPPRDR